MDNKFNKKYETLINEITETKSNPFQKLVCNYMQNILQLNFTGNIKFISNDEITQFIISVKYGNIVIEIDSYNPDTLLIYAKITNTKVLALNDLSSNVEIYTQELPFTWEVLNEDGWITVIEKANQAIINQANRAGLK
jgi:hypothetical protein